MKVAAQKCSKQLNDENVRKYREQGVLLRVILLHKSVVSFKERRIKP